MFFFCILCLHLYPYVFSSKLCTGRVSAIAVSAVYAVSRIYRVFLWSPHKATHRQGDATSHSSTSHRISPPRTRDMANAKIHSSRSSRGGLV